MKAIVVVALSLMALVICQEDYYNTAICQDAPWTEPCLDPKERFHHNNQTEQCELIPVCEGSHNRYETMESCQLYCSKPTTLRPCPSICILEYAPICGSNGKTYSNECFLKVDVCRTGTNITKVYDGLCEP